MQNREESVCQGMRSKERAAIGYVLTENLIYLVLEGGRSM